MGDEEIESHLLTLETKRRNTTRARRRLMVKEIFSAESAGR